MADTTQSSGSLLDGILNNGSGLLAAWGSKQLGLNNPPPAAAAPPPPPPGKSPTWLPWAIGGGVLVLLLGLVMAFSGGRR